jgi:hypothetical protein
MSMAQMSLMVNALEWVGFAVFLSTTYLLVIFVTASFVATDNGPIRWEKGWEETLEFIGVEDD